MKYFKILTILFFTSIITLYSCKEKVETPKAEVPSPALSLPSNAEPAQNERGLWHYTCLKGCDGGAGAAVNCTTCGGLLVHNTAYHVGANSAPASAPFAMPVSPTANTEPAQNAAGVWHYTCGKGCAGGSGTASNCGSCGAALAHNVAYHQ